MLDIKNLTVQIEHNRILDGLSLAVKKGEVMATLGPNRSGEPLLSRAAIARKSAT